MRSNIFPHFLNRDSRQISGLFTFLNVKEHKRWLKAGLNASAILCEDHIITPPGFTLECDVAFSVVEEQIEYIKEGLIITSMRENNFLNLVVKKRQEYLTEKVHYQGIYDDRRVEFIAKNLSATTQRRFSAGDNISSSWMSSVDKNKHIWNPIKSSLGYKEHLIVSKIPTNLMLNGTAATWKSISRELSDAALPSASLIRDALQHEYFMGYIKNYNLNIIKRIPYINSDFGIKIREKIYIFPKLLACFEAFHLTDLIFEASARTILCLKKIPVFIDFIDTYTQICTQFNSDTDLRYIFSLASKKANIEWDKEFEKRKFLGDKIVISDFDCVLGGLSLSIDWLHSEYSFNKRTLDKTEMVSKKENITTQIMLDDVIVVAAQQELDFFRKYLISNEIEYNNVPRLADIDGDMFCILDSQGKKRVIGVFLAQSKGKSGMQELIRHIFNHHQPYTVIMIGMMAGIKGKSHLLDVISPIAIHDVTAIGTKDGEIIIEPETSIGHPYINHWLTQYDWNKNPLTFQNDDLRLITHKKTLCVSAKWDDIAHEICEKALQFDNENIIGLEMEGSAITVAQMNELLKPKSPIRFLMIKGVADYAGKSIDEKEHKKLIGILKIDVAFEDADPINNSILRKALQQKATNNSIEVSLRVLTECAYD